MGIYSVFIQQDSFIQSDILIATSINLVVQNGHFTHKSKRSRSTTARKWPWVTLTLKNNAIKKRLLPLWNLNLFEIWLYPLSKSVERRKTFETFLFGNFLEIQYMTPHDTITRCLDMLAQAKLDAFFPFLVKRKKTKRNNKDVCTIKKDYYDIVLSCR